MQKVNYSCINILACKNIITSFVKRIDQKILGINRCLNMDLCLPLSLLYLKMHEVAITLTHVNIGLSSFVILKSSTVSHSTASVREDKYDCWLIIYWCYSIYHYHFKRFIFYYAMHINKVALKTHWTVKSSFVKDYF